MRTPIRIARRTNQALIIGILLLADLLMIYLSFFLSAELRRLVIPWMGGSVYWPAYSRILQLGLVSAVAMFAVNRLYPGYGLTAVVELERVTKALSVVYLFLALAIYVLGADSTFPRSIFLFAWIFSIILVSFFRLVLRNRLSLTGPYGIPVLFIIQNPRERAAVDSVYRCRRMGWKIKGVYFFDFDYPRKTYLDFQVLRSWEEMLALQAAEDVETVIISNQILDQGQDSPQGILRRLTNLFKKVVIVMPDLNLGSVWVNPRDLEGYLGLEVAYQLLVPYKRLVKSAIDLIGGILLLILFSPVFLVLSLVIYLDDPGPILFRQERLGLDRKIIRTYKFRSMVVDAEEQLISLLESDLELKKEYETFKKLENDPRITRIGRLLRKYSLDEIPQILNVVQGDMSLVGPRAYIPGELEEYPEFANLILRVKPGMTGWWQVMGRNELTFEGRLRRDEYYLSNWSLWLDFYILIRTVWVVVSGKGQ